MQGRKKPAHKRRSARLRVLMFLRVAPIRQPTLRFFTCSDDADVIGPAGTTNAWTPPTQQAATATAVFMLDPSKKRGGEDCQRKKILNWGVHSGNR